MRTTGAILLCGAVTSIAGMWGGWIAIALAVGGILAGAAVVHATLADLRAARVQRSGWRT